MGEAVEVVTQLEMLGADVANDLYQLWVWMRYESSLHPFMALAFVLIIILAWVLYRGERLHK